MRVLLVITEHTGALTRERLDRYAELHERVASLTTATVESAPYESLEELAADAVILSGSYAPWAEHDQAELERLLAIVRAHQGPMLGICAGLQLQVRAAGGEIGAARQPSRGFAAVDVEDDSDLLAGLGPSFQAFTHHDDEITALPPAFRVLAKSSACAVEAAAADDRPWWGTQFHPERWDDGRPAGRVVLRRFLELAGMPPAADAQAQEASSSSA